MAGNIDFQDVLDEPDIFKLAIRGHAAIEEAIDATIDEAFGGSTPPDLRRLPFRTRLALLSAVTPLSEKYLKPLRMLAQLRHDFAHGRIHDLTPTRARALADEFSAVVTAPMRGIFGSSSPRVLLVACLITGHAVVMGVGQMARQNREKERKAVKLQDVRQADTLAQDRPAAAESRPGAR